MTRSVNHAATLPQLDSDASTALDGMLRSTVANGNLPGVVAAVTNREQAIYAGAFGYQDVSTRTRMARDTIFRIASMTKPVTSATALMLCQDRELAIDDKAEHYIEWPRSREVIRSFNQQNGTFTTRPARHNVTIRHLLTHTSGLAYDFTSHTWDRLLEAKSAGPHPLDVPLLFEPGERWHYSGSTTVLGVLLEKVACDRLDTLYRRRLFEPLGMVDTAFELEPAKLMRLATLYRRQGDVLAASSPAYEPKPPNERGGSGLLSTADDYLSFLRMFLNDGVTSRGERLLEAETIRAMMSNQIGTLNIRRMPAVRPDRAASFPVGAGADKFGFGFQISTRRRLASPVGTCSWAGINNTHFWIDPTNNIAGVLLTQVLPFYAPSIIRSLGWFKRLVYTYLRSA